MRILRSALLALSLALSPAVVRADSFGRLHGLYFAYHDSDYSGKVGAGLEVGRTWGAQAEHEVGLELDHARWDYSRIPPLPLVGGGGIVGNGSTTSVLANYRYVLLGEREARIRCFAGPFLGLCRTHSDLTYSLSGVYYAGRDSAWGATYGAGAGIRVALFPATTLELGYRYQRIEAVDVPLRLFGQSTTATHTVNLGAADLSVLSAAVRFAF